MRAADFTTYINAVEDPAIDRKFDRLASSGAKAFQKITDDANRASAAMASLIQGRGSAGLGSAGTTRAIQQQATEMRNVARAGQDAARGAEKAARGERAIASAARDAAQQHQALARSLTATSTALNVVQGPLGPLAGRVSAAARAFTTLTGVQLGGAAFGAIGFTVARLGNQYQQLEGRLRPFLSTQREVNSAMKDIAGIADRSRAGLEPVADLYTKLTQSAERYNMSQARVARITRLASQAATLSGGTTQSREAGLYQFAQGISSNRLGGDELRSLLENLPALADAIARGMGVTTGALREMGSQGALSAEQVTAALERSASVIEDRFSRLPPTLSSAATDFTNTLTVMVGEFDRTIGLSAGLTSALTAVSDNLRELTTLAIGVGAAFGVAFAVRRMRDFTTATVNAWRQAEQLQRVGSAIGISARAQAQAEAAAASQRRINAAQDLASAQSRRVAIEQNIALIAAERRALQASVASSLTGGAGNAGRLGGTAYRAAQIEEQRLTRQLQIATQDLTRAKVAETTAKAANTTATNANAVAQQRMAATTAAAGTAASRTAASLGVMTTAARVGGAALNFFGGWVGLALTAVVALTTAASFYGTQQDEATNATDRARKAMEDYADIVDQTTGKVRSLTEAERERAVRGAEQAINDFRTTGGVGDERRRSVAGQLRTIAAPSTYTVSGQTVTTTHRFADELERLAGQMESGPAGYTAAIDEINRRANEGDETFRKLRGAIAGSNEELVQLANAARQGQQQLNLLRGGTDPQWLEKQAQDEAKLAAHVEQTTEAMKRQIAASNTLDDNARYRSNLEDAYKQFNVPSPEAIEGIRTRIANLRRQPIPAGQEKLRSDALAGLNAELDTAIRRNEKYRSTVEGAARDLTKAQTAERDANSALSATNKERREAIDLAKDAAAAALNRGLIDIEAQRPVLGEQEYTRQRLALLSTYDEEINKLEERQAASSRSTSAMVQDLRKQAQAFQAFDQRRANMLGRYTDEPRGVQRAARDIRELRQAQAELGEGFYPRSVMEQDIRNIEFGLRRPFRELIRDQERQQEVQMLTLQGRETEARVLEQVHRLLESVGEVTAEEHAQLLSNAVEQERINEILVRRERLVSALRGTIDETRSTLETFLTNLSNPGPAARNLALSFVQQFQRVQMRNIVERITAGADTKLRELVNGRNTVEGASRAFAAQIDTTASEVLSLADASRSTAQIMVSAAADIKQGVADALAAGAQQSATGAVTGATVGQTISRVERMLQPLALGGRRATISSGFGWRTHPVTGERSFHGGVDLPAAHGTPVRSAFSGVVTAAGPRGALGNAVTVDHGNGLRTIYGHLSSISVKLGQVVDKATQLGGVGSTGRSTGNHLHLTAQRFNEASKKWESVDPTKIASHTIQVATRAAGRAVAEAIRTPLGITPGGSRARAATGLIGLTGIVNALPDDGESAVTQSIRDTTAALRKRSQDATIELLMRGQSSRVDQLESVVNSPEMEARRREERAGTVPSAREAYNEIGREMGAQLDKTFGTGQFFTKVGKSFGTALEGAGRGAIASGFADALGIKQSQTGAMIGGGIGQLVGGPVGGFIGGLIGGTVGGLFKKPKYGTAGISMDQFGNISSVGGGSRGEGYSAAATGAAGSVAQGIAQLEKMLGATISGLPNMTIGMYKDRWRVSTSGYSGGPLNFKGDSARGLYDFGDDQQAAIEFMIKEMIGRATISGISQASINIIKKGKDLQASIEKAVAIESIPKRLMQIQDPVRYAITELNREFAQLITYLKEGGATAEQFAQAQQLYELQRAEAVKQAAETMFGAIDDYLKEMVGGSSSPLNRRTVYRNAQTEFNRFTSDIQAGRSVDQDDLLNAARAFQEASRTLNGSSSAFFGDFDFIYDLLSRAKQNAQDIADGAGGGAGLPGSPFDGDPAVQRMIDAYRNTTSAVTDQTSQLGGLLRELIDTVEQQGVRGYRGTSISSLPGFVERVT